MSSPRPGGGREQAPGQAAPAGARPGRGLPQLLALAGPGLVAMLADTDAGSVVTASQSGAQFGYRMVLLQFALVPFMYVAQEMTARLGLATGKGHGALIREHFGPGWAMLSAATLFAACLGALVTEFAGVAGAGTLAGLPRTASVGAVVLALAALVLTVGYRRIEWVAITVGLLELAFLPAAVLARPDGRALLDGLAHPVSAGPGYLTLLAANVGSTVIPWMLFYQQGAIVEKGTRGLPLPQALRSARADTLIGALLCQTVTAAIVVASAATIGTTSPGASLHDIAQIADGLTPFLGRHAAVILFGLGMAGASLVAVLVVALAGGWGLSEVLGWRHSLGDSPRRAAGFYTLVVAAALAAAALVLLAPDLVDLSMGVQVMNACLLPVVLGFLLALERRALPPQLRTHGAHRAATLALTGLVIAFGLFTAAQLILTAHT